VADIFVPASLIAADWQLSGASFYFFDFRRSFPFLIDIFTAPGSDSLRSSAHNRDPQQFLNFFLTGSRVFGCRFL